MKLESLQDLFVEQLQDLYSAERQLVAALPKMSEAATSPNLKKAFDTHLKQTEGHVERLTQIFQMLDKSPGRKKCKAMAGLVEEGNEIIEENAEPEVKDAGLIAAGQRVEHYEMAGYGTVHSYAQLLGNNGAAQILAQTLDEEKKADLLLTQLAEREININAQSSAGASKRR